MTETHPIRVFLSGAPSAEPPLDAPAGRRRTATPDLRAPRSSPHDGRSPRRAPTPTPVDPEAQRFTETALRLVLEVLDRRRQPPQLRRLLAPALVDLVAVLARAATPARRLGVAQLQRVHLRPTGPEVAEVFGTYARGGRSFAIAGRLERSPAAPGDDRGGWLITSLQVG